MTYDDLGDLSTAELVALRQEQEKVLKITGDREHAATGDRKAALTAEVFSGFELLKELDAELERRG